MNHTNSSSILTIDQIMDYTEKWLLTGELHAAMLDDKFQFISPFWESNDKETFLDKFLDPTIITTQKP